ncbi:hypothetical protein SMGD1_1370 [Sulfurimonas gotlandica GD1]|jgi:hypothetical protein|uniref:Uncharacterized protein n=1 Tax=Sulfurimonas gotlandica (strain DSM 19862 / JCM 16533 / GD1) TaxID=929558 RepID=H1FSG6_SULGG|nr:hypothetical protein [Sulfurimonas gotlandica]EHP29894.1 hypothetical protein SMGD1_1370 [Sulfurimonas gotlandica GD1]
MSKIIILILSFLIANADSFNFTELRYSDALGRSMELNGEISFLKNGLSINYKESKKNLRLQDSKLTYKEDGQEIILDESQTQHIIQYLETIILLHSGDGKLLKSMFDVEIHADKTLLKPKGSLRHFVNSIELEKSEKKLKEIKLFLKNSDKITIKIADEIR